MNPQEALNLLDRAVSQVNANRETHILLVRALEVLKGVLAEPAAEEVKDNG